MSNHSNRGVVDVCAIRTTRLSSTGRIAYGSDALYVCDTPISVGITDTVTSTDSSVLKNGCGNKCVVKNSQPEQVSEVTLDLVLCKWDAELREMLTDHLLLTRAGNSIGNAYPDPTAPIGYGAIVEFWTKSYDGDTQVSTSAEQWRHFAFPKGIATLANRTLAEGAQSLGMSITCSPNSAAYLGPAGDWPAVFDGPAADWLDSAPPSATCTFASLAS